MAKSGRRPAKGAPERKQENPALTEPVRLNRYIAWAGLCSRRKADELIADGRVRVNNDVVTQLGTMVNPGDQVSVSGKTISPNPYVYLLLNKPKDVLTTKSDERNRPTVMGLVKDPRIDKAGVFPVGRLDRDTLGVLLMTNDGDLAYRLMHPSYEIEKIYVVETREGVKPHEIERLKIGVVLEDGEARADQVGYVDPQDHHRIALQIHEGRNRQVRRMIKAIGHEIIHLERIRYAGLTVGGLKRGAWRHLAAHEVSRLRSLVHLK